MTTGQVRLLVAAVFGLFVPMFAHATLTVTPITWNVVGLDSNNPPAGPKFFPVGARVCSNVATTNVGVNWNWDSANANINLRSGSLASINLATIGAGSCADAYFEIEVNQVAAAYDTMRRYHITATDGSGTTSSPTPREIYVEHLISQNRNSITGVKLNGLSIPSGGSMNLVVGDTYTIELDGGTATQGYNQFEQFINFPNTIFQILSVSTTYSADNSPYVPGPAPIASDKLYADACLWQSDTTSPNYRSCIGGDYKAGGSTVVTTYTIKVISGGGTSQTLYSLLYDFSGSSYHYNSDFPINTFIANVIDPAGLSISKSFSPTPTIAGGTSTLTFTISNPNPSPVSGASFSDTLPTLSGSQMVVATPTTFSTSGCGSPAFAPTAGASSISFANGNVAANSSCVVNVQVSVPSTPTSGTYSNTSGHLFVGGIDTGHFATANLGLTSASSGSGLCGQTLANWTVPNGTSANPPDLAGGVPTIKASNVSTATAAANLPADTAIVATSGQNDTTSWQTFGYKSLGQYVDFVVDTSKYTGVQMSFYVANPSSGNGPTSIVLSYDNGSGFTSMLTINNPATAFTQHNVDFTGLTSTSGSTTFRLSATGAKNDNNGAGLNYDNIAFTGCAAPAQPTLTKAFLPNPVAVNGTSTLTFTLSNPNTAQLTGAKFSDSLPSGLQVASVPNASTTCTGSPSWAPSAGSTTLAFGQTTGANIAASGSCTVKVDVTATSAGPHTNVSGFISSTEGGTNSGPSGSATASLSAVLPPSIAKSFGTNPILANAPSLLTFTIANPNTNDVLNGIAFADTYPAGLANASPLSPPVADTCGGSVTATAGGNSISLAGGSLTGGASCTVSITVIATAAGVYANTSGAVSALVAGIGNTASASVTVNPPHPAISVLKQVATSPGGPWFKFLSVAPTTPLYYQFTVENTGDVALNPFSVSDPTLAGTAADPSGCVWLTTNAPSTLPVLPVATTAVDPTATCVVGPISAANGDKPNTATAHGTYSATVYNSNPASADYIGATPGFSLLKQIGTSAGGPWSSAINVAAGAPVFYKFTLINTGGLILSSISVTDAPVSTASCTFTDPLPVSGATTCIVGPIVASGSAGSTTTNTATGHGSNGGTALDTSPSSASYTIASTLSDLAITKDDGTATVIAGGTTSYTITVTNNGPAEVSNATVTDIAPAGMSISNWSCVVSNPGSGGSVTTACGAASGSSDLNTTVTMKVGAVVTYTLHADVGPSATGSLINTATVTPPAGVTDPDLTNNSATDSDTVASQVTLAMVKTDGSATYTPGGTAVYTITVTDTGASDATNVSLSDLLPPGVTLTANVGCVTNGNASCGTVTGSTGATSFGTTGATVGSGIGNSLVFTVPVAFASGMTANPLVNTATATDLATSAMATGSDSDTLAPQVTIAVAKSDGSSTYTPGGIATYTVTVTHGGLSDATNVIVSDTLPPGVTLSANASCIANGSASCGTVSGLAGQTAFGATGARIAAGPGNALTFTAPVAFSAAMTTDPLVNTATAVDLLSGASGSATDSDARSPQVSLAVTKTDGSASYTPGGAATYTVTVINTGVTDALNVSVADVMPAGVTLTGNVVCTPNAGASCGIVIGNAGQTSFGATGAVIAAGGGSSLVFSAPVAFASNLQDDPLVNTATANDLASGANGSGADSDVRAAQTGLAITKTDGSATYTPGGVATYTIVVTNSGLADALNTIVSDVLPAGVMLAANANCVPAGIANCGTLTGSAGQTSFGTTGASVAAGAANSLTFTVPVAFASSLNSNPLINTVVATDPSAAQPVTATDSDALNAVADLAIAKSDGVTTVAPGQTLTYTIVVSNAGPSDVVGATVSDALSPLIVSATWTCVASAGTCTASGMGSISDIVSVPASATLTYTVVATISPTASGSLVNTATVIPPGNVTDPNPANNSATDVDTVTSAMPMADLSITKTDGVTVINAGAATTYTIVVSNAGSSAAGGAIFTDPAVPNLNLTAVTCGNATGGGACPPPAGTTVALMQGAGIVIPTLPSGGSVTFTVNATVASAAASTIANTASVSPPAGIIDPNASNNSATDTDTVAVTANLALSKTSGSTTYAPGGTATYTISVTNSGPSDATGVTVTDNLPSGVTLVGNVSCTAIGSATCGSVSGAAGGTSFTATGATIAAGPGNRLDYSLPVSFAASLTLPQITNTATASAPAAASIAAGSATSTMDPPPIEPQPIPVDDLRALWLLSCLVLVLGGGLARTHAARR